MLAGHYASAFVAKSVEPQLPLWLVFVAAQFVDLIWGVLVLAGVERTSLDYSLPSNPMVADYMPYTHSLLGTAIWAALAWVVVWKFMESRRFATLTALVVLSHWFLDLVVHRPDLTLAGFEPKLGLKLWNHPALALCVELGVLVLSFLLLRRQVPQAGKSALILLVVLLAVQFYSTVAPPPPNVTQMAASLLVFWLAMPALAAWLERRSSRAPA